MSPRGDVFEPNGSKPAGNSLSSCILDLIRFRGRWGADGVSLWSAGDPLVANPAGLDRHQRRVCPAPAPLSHLRVLRFPLAKSPSLASRGKPHSSSSGLRTDEGCPGLESDPDFPGPVGTRDAASENNQSWRSWRCGDQIICPRSSSCASDQRHAVSSHGGGGFDASCGAEYQNAANSGGAGGERAYRDPSRASAKASACGSDQVCRPLPPPDLRQGGIDSEDWRDEPVLTVCSSPKRAHPPRTHSVLVVLYTSCRESSQRRKRAVALRAKHAATDRAGGGPRNR